MLDASLRTGTTTDTSGRSGLKADAARRGGSTRVIAPASGASVVVKRRSGAYSVLSCHFDTDTAHIDTAVPRAPRDRVLVGAWLLAVCVMLLVMIVLGGATRLTGSGLSIMEWAPLSGALPPWSDAEWHPAVRALPADPAIQAGERRPRSGRLQAHLLAGMDAPAVGPADRRGVPAAAAGAVVARGDPPRPLAAPFGPVRAGWAAGRGRLGSWSPRLRRRQHGGVGLPPGGAPGARARAVRGAAVDRARRAAAGAGAPRPPAGVPRAADRLRGAAAR